MGSVDGMERQRERKYDVYSENLAIIAKCKNAWWSELESPVTTSAAAELTIVENLMHPCPCGSGGSGSTVVEAPTLKSFFEKGRYEESYMYHECESSTSNHNSFCGVTKHVMVE